MTHKSQAHIASLSPALPSDHSEREKGRGCPLRWVARLGHLGHLHRRSLAAWPCTSPSIPLLKGLPAAVILAGLATATAGPRAGLAGDEGVTPSPFLPLPLHIPPRHRKLVHSEMGPRATPPGSFTSQRVRTDQ